jgi:hypothetical protein
MAEYHLVERGDRWLVQRRGDGTLIGNKAGSVVSTHGDETAAIEWARADAGPEDAVLVHRGEDVERIDDA